MPDINASPSATPKGRWAGSVENQRWRALRARGGLCASLLCLAAGACVPGQDKPAPQADAIHIGTVLPFSGARAASGVALERAMRLAIDEVNAAGGLGGRPLWLNVEDSHSDDARGASNALRLIDSIAMPFFVGTEEPEIAYQLTSAIKARQMVHLMPGLTSAEFHDPSAQAAWFRLSPSVAYLSCALAKHLLQAGVTRASVVIAPDDYGGNFATRFGRVFSSKGGTPLPTLQLDPSSSSFAETFATLAQLSPDGVALITSPSVAARFLQEWAVRGKPLKLYLGPTLNTPELLRNVPMGVLEGMQGVSADLGDRATAFDAYFQAKTSVPPIAGAHYYYDAVAMLALAVTEGITQTGGVPVPAMMKTHMLSISSAAPTLIAFDQLAHGLELLAAGQRVEYYGAAGSYVLNSRGDSTQNRAVIWEIRGSEFASLHDEACEVAEVESGGL